MSLEERVVAAVQAIAADIKALLGRSPVVLRSANNQAVTGTAVVAVTGLSASLVAGASYRITGRLLFQSSGLTAGVTVATAGPVGSNGLFVIAVPTTALLTTGTSTIRTNGATGSATTTAVAATGTTMVATIDGVIHVGVTAGSFALQFASSGLGATATVLKDSTLVVERLT